MDDTARSEPLAKRSETLKPFHALWHTSISSHWRRSACRVVPLRLIVDFDLLAPYVLLEDLSRYAVLDDRAYSSRAGIVTQVLRRGVLGCSRPSTEL